MSYTVRRVFGTMVLGPAFCGLLLNLSPWHSLLFGDEQKQELRVSQDNPAPGQPFVVILQPDFDESIASRGEIPDGTYQWTVEVDPVTTGIPPLENKPLLVFTHTPKGAKFIISLVTNVGETSKTFGPTTVSIGQVTMIRDDRVSAKGDFEILQETTLNFAAVCRQIAAAMNDMIEVYEDGSDPTEFKTLVFANVVQTLERSIREEEVRKRWKEALTKFIQDRVRSGDTFAQTKSAFVAGAEALVTLAETVESRSSSPLRSEDERSEDEIIDRIVDALTNPPLELTKGVNFKETAEILVTALTDLREEIDGETVSVAEYQRKTKRVWLDVLGSQRHLGVFERERWEKSYDVFVQAIEQSDKLDFATAKGWDTAIILLVTGLEKAVGMDKKWEKVAETGAFPSALLATLGASKNDGTGSQLITNSLWSSVGFLVFGLSIILVQALIMYSRKQEWDELAFKSAGLTLLITAGVFALTAGYGKDQVNPLFGLLGALAGYLLGKEAKVRETIVGRQDTHPETTSSAEAGSGTEHARQPESPPPSRPTKKT